MLETAIRWDGCYDENWRGLIVPEAFAHPAKMARGLVVRIFDYLLASGVLHRGDLVVDPFGGIGSTAIEGASRDVRVICCELEPKFVALARRNIEAHRRDWDAMGRPIPVIVQGDSRELRALLVAAGVTVVIASPPYISGGHHRDALNAWNTNGRGMPGPQAGYGDDTPGQLGDLVEGSLDAVVSSPPYAEIAAGAGGLNTQPAKHPGQQSGRAADSASQDTDQRYGETDGQLAKLPKGTVDAVVSSPPFPQPYAGGGGINVRGYGPDGADKVGSRTYQGTAGEREDGNLETLTLGNVDAVVTSPPFLDARSDTTRPGPPASMDGDLAADDGRLHRLGACDYGDTDGQLGREQTETFWQAADVIVRECFALLKPGGVAVWVVKAFVRDRKIVDFPGDWRRLCEHVGFETLDEIHASLVHEETHAGLFGDTTTRRERKSFFRRLAEAKGSPRIDWETVWVMRK